MKRYVTVLLICLLVGQFGQAAINKDFYFDGAITVGESFGTVNIWNTSLVTMNGGYVNILYGHNSGTLHFSDGEVSGVTGFDTFTTYMSGGTAMGLEFGGSSTLYLSGGSVTGYVAARDQAVVHIFGKDFDFTPTGVGQSGWLSGMWGDNSSFDIYLRQFTPPFPGSGIVLHTVPEPCTLALCAFSFLLVRRGPTVPNILFGTETTLRKGSVASCRVQEYQATEGQLSGTNSLG
jgi:hypothetical protein